jgi:hypothetical protein
MPKPIRCDKKKYIYICSDSLRRIGNRLNEEEICTSLGQTASRSRRPYLSEATTIKLRTFFHNKDCIAKHMQSNSVYSVKGDDYGQTYVEKTDRKIKRRMKKHGASSDTFKSPSIAKRKPSSSKLCSTEKLNYCEEAHHIEHK